MNEQNNRLFCSGWTSSSSRRPTPAAKRKKPTATAPRLAAANIYAKLKESILLPQVITSEESISVDNYVAGDSTDSCKSNIISLNNLINQAKGKMIKYHYILEFELTKYKLLSFVRLCSSCSSDDDEYKALSCQRYIRFACNADGLSCFMNFSCDTLNCTKDWVNFLIAIGRLCKRFPKFKYTTLSLKQLKANMKVLIKSMTSEELFWQL